MKPVVMLSVESCIRKTCGKAVMAAFVKPASKAVSRCFATQCFTHVGAVIVHTVPQFAQDRKYMARRSRRQLLVISAAAILFSDVRSFAESSRRTVIRGMDFPGVLAIV